MDDSVLLQAYIERGDERAFEQIVQRHIDLVYSAARRQVRDAHLAEDVTQAVFIVLARKAASVKSAAYLPAWLMKTARFISRDTLRGEARRKTRQEQAAITMSSTANESSSPDEAILPLLDDALDRLNETDRAIVTLRYLKGMSISAAAAAVGISEAAAQKRLSRAVDKLRASFARRGITMPSEAMGVAIESSMLRAPEDLHRRITRNAITAKHVAVSIKPSIWAGGTGVSAVAAITCCVVLLAGLIAHGMIHSNDRAAIAASPRKIKVGVLISEATAAGWINKDDGAYDISHQSIALYLKQPQIERYILLEPGSHKVLDSGLADLPRQSHWIDATDAAALKNLDVIVADHVWRTTPQVVTAIHDAVNNGVGFLDQSGFGLLSPYLTRPVSDLGGMEYEGLFSNAAENNCKVVNSHPLLNGLKPGDTISGYMFYGEMGPLHGTPLLAGYGWTNGPFIEIVGHMRGELAHRPYKVTDEIPGHTAADLLAATSPPTNTELLRSATTKPMWTLPASADSEGHGMVFYPLYVSQLGKGRIVNCQWHNAAPAALDPKHDGTFYLHCVQWLANRAVE